MLFLPSARSLLGPAGRGIRRSVVRNFRRRGEPDFDAQYGNMILISGALFCAAVWGYALTQTGFDFYLSPVGRITPKEWKED